MTTDDLARPQPAPSREDGASRAKAWGFTGLLMLLYIINWGDKAVFGLVAQPLAKEFGLSASQVGLVGSAFFLTFTLGGFLAGLVNKWMTLRWALVALSLVWAASMLPTVFAAGFAVLLVSRMLLGLGEGPAGALVHAGVYSWHPVEKRGLPSACIAGCASVAKIAVAPALAVVVAAWGWRAAFVALAVVGVAWCAIWLPTWRVGPYGEERAEKKGDRPSADGQDTAGWSTIFLTPTFLGGSVAIFAMYGLVTVVLTWLPSYFEVGLGYSRVQAGTMFGVPSIAALVFMLLSTAISDKLLVRGASSRILRGVLPSVALLLCGLALVTLPAIDAPPAAVVVVSVGYGLGSTVFPLYNAGLSEICPPGRMAGALGVFLAMASLGGLVAPYLTGVIVDAAADPAAGYANAFQVFGAAAIVGGAVALATVDPVRDARRVLGRRHSPYGTDSPE